MSDEKPCNSCIQIKELMDAKLAAHNIRMDSIQEGIALARKEMEHRLMLLNELRREVTDDRATFVSREAYMVKMAEIDRALSHNWINAITLIIAITTALAVLFKLLGP